MVRCRRDPAILDGSANTLYMKGPEYETINALGAKPYIIDPAFILLGTISAMNTGSMSTGRPRRSVWPWSFTSGAS